MLKIYEWMVLFGMDKLLRNSEKYMPEERVSLFLEANAVRYGHGEREVRIRHSIVSNDMSRCEGSVSGQDHSYNGSLEYVLNAWEENAPCSTCRGTGEVSTMEEVEQGNPQTMADVGSRRCPDCQSNEDEDA